MGKIILCLLLACSSLLVCAQNEEVKKLVKEGIALHDQGDYEGAIRKYDEALAIDKDDYYANYEKSLTCLYAKRLDECISICKMLIEKYPNHPEIKAVYSNYGSAVDDAGKPKEAIEIFDKAIQKFPGDYLLYFNKGLSFMRMKNYDQALESYTAALKYNALHPSSNYYTGAILEKEHSIPALLAYCSFVALEPQSSRSQTAFEAIQGILKQNVNTEGNTTTLFVSPEMLKKKKKKNQENDFSDVELGFSMLGILDQSKEMDTLAKTNADKFDFKLQMLINLLDEHKKGQKGFYWEHYVPFFSSMKENNYTAILSHLIYRAGGDQDSTDWIRQNQEKLKAFYDWLGSYKWN